MNHQLRALLEINLATLFIATSGVLVKSISLAVPVIILSRCIIGLFFLFLLIKFFKESLQVNFLRDKRFFILSGFLLAGHWLTYFYSIQISTVAVAVISLFTFPVVTTLLEPLFFKTRIDKLNIVLSVIVIGGIILIVPSPDLNNNITLGVLFGIISSVMYACRNLMSKKYVTVYPGTSLLFYQLVVALFFLLPPGFYYLEPISTQNLIYLILLGLFTTALGHMLFLRGLKHYSASTASIISSLQPVYAIILAVIFIGEKLETRVIFGGAIIFAVVIIQNLKQLKRST
ncbi:DMT family transporter [Fulvivirgaceae bacterium BMA12]|uniref:DMT family transporter n=1 Tax=Agaribacillus aureus TaxID=3051825 RepID=A0ABT8LH92_9BACT|nr:DMT family transporter [Fulvivirgaceae bacterium BMA12]